MGMLSADSGVNFYVLKRRERKGNKEEDIQEHEPANPRPTKRQIHSTPGTMSSRHVTARGGDVADMSRSPPDLDTSATRPFDALFLRRNAHSM